MRVVSGLVDAPAPTHKDAAARRHVVLRDGRVGVLLWVSPTGERAKVRVGGHHERHLRTALRVLPAPTRAVPDQH